VRRSGGVFLTALRARIPVRRFHEQGNGTFPAGLAISIPGLHVYYVLIPYARPLIVLFLEPGEDNTLSQFETGDTWFCLVAERGESYHAGTN